MSTATTARWYLADCTASARRLASLLVSLDGLDCADRRARPLVASRHGRGRKTERFGHRLRAPLVLPTRQPRQDPPHHPLVRSPRLLEPAIHRERNLLVTLEVAHPRHLDRQLLVRKVHRSS